MTEPVLSIITVSYRAKDQIQTTMTSILAQTWKNFEYLVIDGKSDDGTENLLLQASESFSQAGISFRFISEPDHGIYDAMNKGTRMAQGEWLLFLNAGDLLADVRTLEHVFQASSDAQVIYGDTLCTYQGQTRIYPALPLNHLTYEMPFCHQSAFISRHLMLEHPYDTTYKVCADHHFFLTVYLQNITFEYRNFSISIYEISGYSDRNKLLSHQEKHRMQKETGVFHFSLSWLMRECAFYFKLGIKMIFGQRLIDQVRKNRLH